MLWVHNQQSTSTQKLDQDAKLMDTFNTMPIEATTNSSDRIRVVVAPYIHMMEPSASANAAVMAVPSKGLEEAAAEEELVREAWTELCALSTDMLASAAATPQVNEPEGGSDTNTL